jgi:hypothetical protein
MMGFSLKFHITINKKIVEISPTSGSSTGARTNVDKAVSGKNHASQCNRVQRGRIARVQMGVPWIMGGFSFETLYC